MKQLLLVRHGQASFGARSYDALSERGHTQSRLLGRALANSGVVPDLIVHGRHHRHEETAAAFVDGLRAPCASAVDGGWDEFDFRHVLQAHKPRYRNRAVTMAGLARTTQPRQAFQKMFEEATLRWASGRHDDDYHEPFHAFTSRVQGALSRSAALAPERGTVVVVTSGGPIAAAGSYLLAGDASLWPRLNTITVNTAVTKILNGRRGLTLSVFNAHGHLEHDPDLLTYR